MQSCGSILLQPCLRHSIGRGLLSWFAGDGCVCSVSSAAACSGGGAWGTALAIHAAKMGHATLLWAREPEVVASINGTTRENTMYLKVRWRRLGMKGMPSSKQNP